VARPARRPRHDGWFRTPERLCGDPGDPAWLLSRHTRLVHTEKVGRSVTTVTARVSGADRPGLSFLGGLVPAGVVGDRIPPRRLCQAIGFAAARSAKSVSSAHVLTEDPGRTVGRSTIPRKRAAASLKLFSAPGEPRSSAQRSVSTKTAKMRRF
jgi:hypothetical protein